MYGVDISRERKGSEYLDYFVDTGSKLRIG
jgi:hypothetical protein